MAAELSAHEGMPPPNLSYEKLHGVLFGNDALLHGMAAHYEHDAVGYALWNAGYDMQHGIRTLNVVDLFVKRENRRRGIARSLVHELACIAIRGGYELITVQTFTENQEANAFYRACGMKLDATNAYYLAPKHIGALLSKHPG